MISRRFSSRSNATVSSNTSTQSSASGWATEQVLRKKYKDPIRLREGLDQLLGKGQYTLRLRHNRYIIHGQKTLDENELATLEEYAYQHYDSF